MKKPFFLALGIFMILGLLGSFEIWRMAHPSLAAIAKFAPLWFPADTKLISSLDNGEMSMHSVVRFTSETDVTDFLNKNKFIFTKSNPLTVERLCQGNHSVEVSLNPATRELEITIGYPDFGGSSPCP